MRTESFTLDARFHLLAVPIDLVGCEVAISVIDHLELAATDGDEGIGEQLQTAADTQELCTHIVTRLAIVLAEPRDYLEVRAKPTRQPGKRSHSHARLRRDMNAKFA